MSVGNGKWAPRSGHIPGAVVNLGGHELVLAPLNLDQVREFDELAKAGAAGGAEDAFAVNTAIIHASLSRNYPDLDLAHVRALLDTQNVVAAMKAIADPSGMRIAKPGELGPTPE